MPFSEKIISKLTNPVSGIIDVVGQWPPEKNTPNFYYYQAAVKIPTQDFSKSEIVLTAGVSLNKEKAIQKAIGEAIERYCGAIQDGNQNMGSYKNLPYTGTHPDEFALFSKEQYANPKFPFRPFTEFTTICWTEANDAKSGASVWVPSCSVYSPYTFLIKKGEVPIIQPISTGMASHTDYESAVLNAILEVIERDCVSLTWQASIPRPRLNLENLPVKFTKTIERFRTVGYDVQILFANNDIPVPTFIAVMKSEMPNLVPMTLSAATHVNKNIALIKCLEELALMERALKSFVAGRNQRPVPDLNQILDFKDQQIFWSQSEFANKAEFLLSNPDLINFSEIKNCGKGTIKAKIEHLSNLIYKSGHRILIKNLTQKKILDWGFYTVKAIIPGYHPIASGHVFRAQGGKRLWSLPQKLGFKGIDKVKGDNPLPCPFT